LLETARNLLRANLPSIDSEDRPIDRPTLLPVPGELPAHSEIAGRLRRLGGIGRPLCDRPVDSPPASPALLDLLAEARLFFDYLREDFNAALVSLETLEPRLTTRDHRARLLGVRAQVFLGLKQTDQATKTIALLRVIDAKPRLRFEQSASGPALIDEAARTRSWPSYLTERAGEIVRADAAARDDHPLGHRNPDNPNPNADLIPGPAGAPIPFAPMIRVAPPFLPVFPEFEEPPGAGPNQPVFPPRLPHRPRAQAQAPGR